MVKCDNCGCKVFGKALFCCHCGYPMAAARLIPWPRQLWPVSPRQFWKVTMRLSLLLAAVAAIGIVVHAHRGLPCLYCGYPFVLSLPIYFWAYLGSEKCLG